LGEKEICVDDGRELVLSDNVEDSPKGNALGTPYFAFTSKVQIDLLHFACWIAAY
jgi:hypothetical protein